MSGFMDNLKKAAGDLMGGNNQGILDALKKMTPTEIQGLAPGDSESENTFQKILNVVENATKSDAPKTELISNIIALGTKAIAMAKNIPILSKLMG